MRTRIAVAALLVASSACSAIRAAAPVRPPLGNQGEVHVYVLPLPRDAERVSFTVESASLLRRDGGEVPLRMEEQRIVGAQPRPDQRRLAAGRAPPGEYVALTLKVSSATFASDGDPSRLLVDAEPFRVELAFELPSGRAVVIWLRVEPGAVRPNYSFSPHLVATIPPLVPPQSALYCTGAASQDVVGVDRGSRFVTGVMPVEGTPRGIAVDPAARRAYVALSREDRIEVLDLAAGTPMGRIRLSPGDHPGDVALAPDGKLVVVNEGTRTVSFVDPGAMAELSRVPVGDDPTGLMLDRAGRRAYVANRSSATVTVLDLANRAVLGTIATDPEPLRVALSRDGTRLYVVHRGSAYLATFVVPSLVPLSRVYVGLGATTVKVDQRTDLVYLSHGDRRISVHDPFSLQPMDRIDLPGSVSQMTIDDAANTLLALMPERRTIAVVDLTSRALLSEIPVGAEPYAVAFAGERL
jgi:YVTN family beta-propeller protein